MPVQLAKVDNKMLMAWNRNGLNSFNSKNCAENLHLVRARVLMCAYNQFTGLYKLAISAGHQLSSMLVDRFPPNFARPSALGRALCRFSSVCCGDVNIQTTIAAGLLISIILHKIYPITTMQLWCDDHRVLVYVYTIDKRARRIWCVGWIESERIFAIILAFIHSGL